MVYNRLIHIEEISAETVMILMFTIIKRIEKSALNNISVIIETDVDELINCLKTLCLNDFNIKLNVTQNPGSL